MNHQAVGIRQYLKTDPDFCFAFAYCLMLSDNLERLEHLEPLEPNTE